MDRVPNLGGNGYTWWSNKPGLDVFTYNPGAAGGFRVWISWGAHGSGVHTRDARYVLDLDGNLETKDERKLVPGICFSIEPGIYLEGDMGVRTEINVFIREDNRVVVAGRKQTDLILVR